ncbi:Cyclin-dependent kinase inhibitor domain-containing protein [Caenorhabditis elegans]|uniref:Cyclin-dependent kinase inhibitor n=1 Tax=Caenorhabditis elegans TaxID=6239 RepID=G5EEJ2_CAEEL|nr:Cyclin-dependent kinase inhibitor domain-containing protein [Caenorhabditis elegans]AAF13869.1 cyclin-dependent kinase inhibitor [Caenorhabditis elegans]CAD45597.1 Cyclin-dependent kinase inhibitor domain-containing protein [Caenorhabditis elegans]|eukprot:NP_001022309.1 CKI family (Cyclin-dependent Kinase Inhibitor) [Caenorhabditis elegans]
MAATTAGDGKRKAARCLFGKPDPEEQVSRQLNSSLEEMYKKDSRKFNFDFSGGVPIVGSRGDYEFESISASEVPSFYREKIVRPRKIIARRNSTPVSDTVEMPSESPPVVESNETPLLIASTSTEVTVYEKPVTRSSAAKQSIEQQETYNLKQTKLTNYMPVRKRRSETCLVTAAVSMSRSVSIDSSMESCKEKRGSKIVHNNKGAPKRPLRFVASNVPKSAQSSTSDTVLVSSPRSPPAKKMTTSTRRSRRPIEAGDF